MHGYYLRIGITIIGLLIATVAAIYAAPKQGEISVVANEPLFQASSRQSPISITFSRPVDQRSAERAFILYPPVRGHFEWADSRTMRFIPSVPMDAGATYRIIIRPGLRDRHGYQNHAETSWPIRMP